MIHTACDRPIKLLFAGGCQVAGYPADESRAFPALAGQMLARAGFRLEVHTLPYLRLPHRRRLIAKCKEVEPDVLVLQLGHSELNVRLSTHLRSLWGSRKRHAHSEDSTIPANLVKGPIGFYIKAGLKRGIDFCLRHPLVDFESLDARWEALLGDVEKCRIPSVVLLSPLPAADLTAMYYRRRALPLFRRIAMENGCSFVDLLAATPRGMARHFGLDDYYFDAIHVGEGGQRAVGEALASHLRVFLTEGALTERVG